MGQRLRTSNEREGIGSWAVSRAAIRLIHRGAKLQHGSATVPDAKTAVDPPSSFRADQRAPQEAAAVQKRSRQQPARRTPWPPESSSM